MLCCRPSPTLPSPDCGRGKLRICRAGRESAKARGADARAAGAPALERAGTAGVDPARWFCAARARSDDLGVRDQPARHLCDRRRPCGGAHGTEGDGQGEGPAGRRRTAKGLAAGVSGPGYRPPPCGACRIRRGDDRYRPTAGAHFWPRLTKPRARVDVSGFPFWANAIQLDGERQDRRWSNQPMLTR